MMQGILYFNLGLWLMLLRLFLPLMRHNTPLPGFIQAVTRCDELVVNFR